MDTVTKTETFDANAAPAPATLPADVAARLSAQIKASGPGGMPQTFKYSPDLETPDPNAANAGAALAKPGAKPAATKATEPAKAPATPERPAWLPEKFKTPEDMAKAYGELEKKQGAKAPEAKPAEAPKAKTTDDLKIGDKPVEGDPAAKAAETAGLDIAKLQTEFLQTGKLSDDSLKAFEKVGITKDVVDQYIAGQQALAEKVHNDIASVAGGPDKFNEMRAWSASNLSDTEKNAFNATLETGNHEAIKLAVAGIHGKWVAAVGQEPQTRLMGDNGLGKTGDVYQSMAQMHADIRNPLYKKDEAFRANVMAKAKRSGM